MSSIPALSQPVSAPRAAAPLSPQGGATFGAMREWYGTNGFGCVAPTGRTMTTSVDHAATKRLHPGRLGTTT